MVLIISDVFSTMPIAQANFELKKWLIFFLYFF